MMHQEHATSHDVQAGYWWGSNISPCTSLDMQYQIVKSHSARNLHNRSAYSYISYMSDFTLFRAWQTTNTTPLPHPITQKPPWPASKTRRRPRTDAFTAHCRIGSEWRGCLPGTMESGVLFKINAMDIVGATIAIQWYLGIHAKNSISHDVLDYTYKRNDHDVLVDFD